MIPLGMDGAVVRRPTVGQAASLPSVYVTARTLLRRLHFHRSWSHQMLAAVISGAGRPALLVSELSGVPVALGMLVSRRGCE
jgi:hypothetical protein